MPETCNANRNYNIAMIVLALLYGLGALPIMLMTAMPMNPAMNQTGKWAMNFSAAMSGLVDLLIVVTLILRATTQDFGRLWTKAVNIFLLICFPFGTAVGIYGLWKVDKQPAVVDA
jgi:hypothetical protein